ncbi:MAG: AzlD domain-containing protein [Rhodobacteraceae bacterium]|jgi:branched-subunit amino acid transport protein AzlD|nr:AzlD domain-containing protein [Paracoccaceae bacterium]
MRLELFLMALAVGVATYAFRVLPTRMARRDLPEGGMLARFLASTGPAAIATLFTASVLPLVQQAGLPVPLVVGTLAVVAVFVWRRSVVLATLAGAGVYGGIFGLLGA